jgi:hypothetical protein
VLRLNRPARLAAALVFGALALAGCANDQILKGDSSHGLHTVRMTVTSTEIPARLTFKVGNSPALTAAENTSDTPCPVTTKVGATPPPCQQANINKSRFAATTVKVSSGTKVSMTGGPPIGPYTISGTGTVLPTDSFTCSISVDGIPRISHVAQTPFGTTPPTCSATGYVDHRPFQLRRLMEFIAFALCLMIVIFGIAVQIMPSRRHA